MKHTAPAAEQMLKPNLWAPIPAHRSSSHRSRHLNLRTSAHGNTFGHSFRVTTFGESHGKGVGCVIDGVPPRLPITKEDIQVLSPRKNERVWLTLPGCSAAMCVAQSCLLVLLSVPSG